MELIGIGESAISHMLICHLQTQLHLNLKTNAFNRGNSPNPSDLVDDLSSQSGPNVYQSRSSYEFNHIDQIVKL